MPGQGCRRAGSKKIGPGFYIGASGLVSIFSSEVPLPRSPMRPTRPLTALSIAALVSAGLVAGAGAAASENTANLSTGPADASYAPDVATAQAIAVAHGHPGGI